LPEPVEPTKATDLPAGILKDKLFNISLYSCLAIF